MRQKPAYRQARDFDTPARERVIGQLERQRARGKPLATNSKKDVAWLRRHAVAMKLLEPEPHIFFFQEDWDAMDRAARSMLLIQGISRLRPGLGFWGFDAALVWGLEVPFDVLNEWYIVSNNIPTTLCSQVHLLRKDAAGPLEVKDGVLVTGFWQTVEACLLRAPFSYGLAIADSALRRTGETSRDLVARLKASASKRRGYYRAVLVAQYAEGRSENGGESRFRAFFIAHGFEIPELQVEFDDPLEQGKRFRVDYAWRRDDGTYLIGELDGMDKYIDDSSGNARVSVKAFSEERQRESRLTLLGFPVLRFSFDELKNPTALAEKMRIAGVPWSEARAASWAGQWHGKRRHPRR